MYFPADSGGSGKRRPHSPLRGYPVNPIAGNKLLAGPADCDFSLPAALPLVWQRIYSSGQRKVGWLGQGWSTPLSDTLHISDGKVVFIDAFQREITFSLPRVGDGLYSLWENITLERTGERHFELIDEQGMRSVFLMLPRAYDTAMLVEMVDPNDNQVTITYNARHLPESVQDSAGRTYHLQFGEFRGKPRLASITLRREPAGLAKAHDELLVQYEYDEEGNLGRVRNRAGAIVREFAYTNHIMVAHALPGGLVSQYEYDEYEWTGKVTRNWASNGLAWDFRYLAGETLVRDNLGREERFRFDKKNRFIGMVDALGGETLHNLDSQGKLLGVMEPGGRNTTYRYDRRSRIVRVESCGKGSGIVYDVRLNKPALVTDALGAMTVLRYDERGNLHSVTDALGQRTSYQYDAKGRPVEVTDAAGGIQKLAYNHASQPVSHTDCAGNSTHFSYDLDGKLLQQTDAQGKVHTYSYDAAGRLCTVLRADGATEHYEYDPLGRLLARVDAAGEHTSYVPDPDGKLARRIDARGGVLEYRYDALRRLIEISNGHGAQRRFAYDALDRLIEDTNGDGQRSCYQYDETGLLAATRIVGGGADPHYPRIETSYTRNRAGQMIERRVSKATGPDCVEQLRWCFAYDDLGRLTHFTHGETKVSLEYDAVGQLVAEHTVQGESSTLLRHAYDKLGQRSGAGSLQGESGQHWPAPATQFRFDALGRMLSTPPGRIGVAEGAVPVIARRYHYDPGGMLLAIDARRFGSARYSDAVVKAILAAARPHVRAYLPEELL